MNGFIVLNKLSGISSNKALYSVKKIFPKHKIGHLGALDPMASGVLPVCVGKATKLFDYFLNKSKEYIADFTFGKTTDTLDGEGQIIEENNIVPTEELIKEKIVNLTGKQEQMPPKFSAKNINGKRAYELSRQGIDFELKPKIIEVFDFKLIEKISVNTYRFFINCSSGTYIRSLARDIAKQCGTVAYMSKLVRTKSGNFTIEKAVDFEKLSQNDLIKIEDVLIDLEKLCVEDKYFEKLKNGNEIVFNCCDKNQFLLYCKNQLFGIAHCKNQTIKVDINLFD